MAAADPLREGSIVVKGLRKVYGGLGKSAKVAVKNLHLAVEPNPTLGLLGPNGSGKSTTISMLTGLFAQSGGEAHVGGKSITHEMVDVQHIMGVCPQHDTLWGKLTVEETFLFYARLKGVPPGEETQHVEDMVAAVGLETKFKDKIDNLSGGQRRRVSIGLALTGGSKIIFLDEPTTGKAPLVASLGRGDVM